MTEDEKKIEKVPQTGDSGASGEKFDQYRGQTHKPTAEQVQVMKRFTMGDGDGDNSLKIVNPNDDPRKQVIAQADTVKSGSAEANPEKKKPRELVIRNELEKLMPPGHAYQLVFKIEGGRVSFTMGRQPNDQVFDDFLNEVSARLGSKDFEQMVREEVRAHGGRWVANLHTNQRPSSWKSDEQMAAQSQQRPTGGPGAESKPQDKPQSKPTSDKVVDHLLTPGPNDAALESTPRPTQWKRDLKGKVEQDKIEVGTTQYGSDKQEPSYLAGSGSFPTIDGRMIPVSVSPEGNQPIAFEASPNTKITCRINGAGSVVGAQGHLEIAGDQRYFVVTHYEEGRNVISSPPGRPFARIPLFKCRRDGSFKY